MGLVFRVIGCYACDLLQAERMTQSEVAALLRTAVYIVVGIPIPAGAAAAVFFLPHSRSAHGPFPAEQMPTALRGCKPGHAIYSCVVLESNCVRRWICRLGLR